MYTKKSSATLACYQEFCAPCTLGAPRCFSAWSTVTPARGNGPNTTGFLGELGYEMVEHRLIRSDVQGEQLLVASVSLFLFLLFFPFTT